MLMGIDSYELAVGKQIRQVLAEKAGEKPIFFKMRLPTFRKDNCFTQTLYFVYDGGVLVTTQYGDFWTDTSLPAKALTDVSERFAGIVGDTIKDFTFENRSIAKESIHYGQPITTIETDAGRKVRFSINFGEVEQEERAAFYELLGDEVTGSRKGKAAILERLWERLKRF